MPILRLLPSLVVFALCATRLPANAQKESPLAEILRIFNGLSEAPPAKPGFTAIAEVNRVFTTPGSAERAVKFSGVVVQSVSSQNYVFVQEGRQGIQVILPKNVPVPALGDAVDVDAPVKFVVANGDTVVKATAVLVTGRPGVKDFQRPKLAEIRAGRLNRQAVEVEAVVLDAFFKTTRDFGGWWLLLSDDDGACLGGIYTVPEGWSAAHLVGKRVRFRGIGVSGGEFILRCSSPDEVTVLGPAAGTGALEPFTTVNEVREYGGEKSRLRQYPVLVRGICTYVHPDKNRFFIHDGIGGAEVRCRPDVCPAPGDAVLVQGITAAGTSGVYLAGWNVEVTGKGKLPVAPRVTLNTTPAPPWGAWIEVEGVVISMRTHRQTGAAGFFIVGDNHWTGIGTATPPPEPVGGWWGARIRVRGVHAPESGVFIHAATAGQITVIAPGLAGPFAAPGMTAAELRARPPAAERVTMKGTVLDFRDDHIYLRDATGAFRADTASHFVADGTYKVLPGAVGWPGDPKPGDELDLVGSPMGGNGTLRFSNVRITGHGEAPPPRAVNIPAVVDGTATNELVTLRGRLASYEASYVSDTFGRKRWRETLHLDDGGAGIEVVSETGGDRGAFAKFVNDDLIEATGIVRPEGGVPAFRLSIRTMDDVRSLGPDPSVARGRLVKVIAIAVAAIFAALAWAGFMRRQVAARTAQLAVANEKLNAALSSEREVGDLKTRFVSLVSHEFRTPLGITMSAVELLRHYADRLPREKLAELHDDIHNATLRMSGMMEQVLLLGRVEAGKLSFTTKALDLPEFCGKLTDESLSATNRKCPVTFTAHGDLSGAAGDESLIRHIILNLISNAVKYSPDGSAVEFTAHREETASVFTVRDHGIGIPAADQARLFEAFYRAKNVGETPGTGLGLLIVKRCVDLHHGTIGFDSREGEGTAFTLRLPLFAA